MSHEVIELGDEHDAALRALLSPEPLRNLQLLGAWDERGRRPPPAPRLYGLFSARRLLAAALVDPSCGRVVPSACKPDDARALGAGLAGKISFQSSFGDQPAVEGLVDALCPLNSPRLLAHRLFTASADNLGPFITPALRLAEEDDWAGLVEMTAAELAESFERDPLREKADAFRAQVLDRIRRQRTWILELEGRLATKLEVAARSQFGAELEGLYTLPEHRFRGCATLALGQLSRHLLSSTPRLTLRIAEPATGLLAVAQKVGYVSVPVQQLLVLA